MSQDTEKMCRGDEQDACSSDSSSDALNCLEHAEALAETLAETWQAIDANVTGIDGADPQQYLDELPLEIVWEKGEPFAVVFGTGGPHVELRGGTRHDGMAYTIHVYWAGEHVTLTGSEGDALYRTGEYFRELVDES